MQSLTSQHTVVEAQRRFRERRRQPAHRHLAALVLKCRQLSIARDLPHRRVVLRWATSAGIDNRSRSDTLASVIRTWEIC